MVGGALIVFRAPHLSTYHSLGTDEREDWKYFFSENGSLHLQVSENHWCNLSGRNRKFKLLTWYFKLATDAVTPQNGFIGGVDIKQELGRCWWSKSNVESRSHIYWAKACGPKRHCKRRNVEISLFLWLKRNELGTSSVDWRGVDVGGYYPAHCQLLFTLTPSCPALLSCLASSPITLEKYNLKSGQIKIRSFDNRFEVNWPPEPTLVLHWIFFSLAHFLVIHWR